MSYTLFLFLAYTIILLSLRYYYKHNRYGIYGQGSSSNRRCTWHRQMYRRGVPKEGASVAVIDVREGDHFVGDISKKEVLEAFADEVIGKYGKVDFIVNNALPLMKGLDECTWE